jgi:two-component system response regulator PilR (NtrC family)
METLSSILLVDDDEGLRKLLSSILERAGYSVKSFESGKEAIAASYEEFFNLALIDIHLPDMKGLELLTKLRKTEPEMIKIIITGQASLDTAIEATNKDADGYVVKPFEPKKLLEMIKLKLSKQRQKVEFDEQKVAEYIESRHEWMSTVGAQKRR